MADRPQVLLSGFADEAANQKTVQQQFAAFAALGLQYFSIRFIDVGGGVKNVRTRTDWRSARSARPSARSSSRTLTTAPRTSISRSRSTWRRT